MGKKSRRGSKTREQRSSRRRSRARSWGFVAFLPIAAAAIYALRSSAGSGPAPVARYEAHRKGQRPFYDDPEEAKPFPATLEPSRFGVSIVSRAYGIARQIPEVLVQQPCHCNCGVLGHRSLLDCYASFHAANCTACLQEAVFTQQMTAAGRTPVEIREDIDTGLWRNADLEGSMP